MRVLVTGAASGIGRATCVRLARDAKTAGRTAQIGAVDLEPSAALDGLVAELQRGLSNTMLIGERTTSLLPSTWLGVDFRGEDAACRLVGTAYTSPNCRECDECEFSSRHAGGANFLWGDGRVQLVSETIDTAEYRRFARRFEF